MKTTEFAVVESGMKLRELEVDTISKALLKTVLGSFTAPTVAR